MMRKIDNGGSESSVGKKAASKDSRKKPVRKQEFKDEYTKTHSL